MNQPQQSLLQLQSILAALLIWSGSVLPSFAADEPFGDFSETPIYEVGEVPFQKVWHGDTLKLRLRSEALGSAAIITATYVLPPTGEIHFSNNGEFGYRPGVGDLHEFTVTFRAQSGNQVKAQTIPISPLPRLPEEESFFGIERGPIPNAEDKQFLIFTEEFSHQTNVFNYFTNLTRQVIIAGKTVVLQQGKVNGLYEAIHERWDLQKLEIHAEKLIIASPIRAPGTEVTIRARELEFQDIGGTSYFSTEPRTLQQAAQFDDGAEGLPAGNMSLFIQSFTAPLSGQARIRLKGGDGQPGGTGQAGTNGTSKDTFARTHQRVSGVPSADRGNVTLVNDTEGFGVYDFSPSGRASQGYNWRPGNGSGAIAGGRPGSGGTGGQLFVNSPSVEAVSVVVGGQFTPGSFYLGGSPGQPVPAYYYRVWSSPDARLGSHTALAGADALPVSPSRIERADGEITFTSQPMGWLSPLALRQVIAHARSAYLNGQLEFVEETFAFYLKALEDLDALRNTPFWVELPPSWELDFAQLADEMRLVRHRIASNLDYFANPPGWVPLLSFEANKIAFEQDIDTSIRVLYLEYWLGDFANNLQQRTAGQEVVREIQKTILEQSRREYDQATQLLPEVQVQAGNMQVRIGELQEEIKIINEELQRRAQRNVEERHKGEPWQQAAGFLGRVCQVIPVYQPILAAVGQGLVLASEYDKNDPWKTLSQVPEVAKQFTSENWDKSVAQTKETLDTLPIPDLDDAELSDIPAIVEDFQTKMKPWKEHWEKMQEATRTPSAPKSEVEAELQKLRREHPELNEITAKVESLIADKEALLLLISQTTQRLGQLNAGIQFSLLAIDAMNQDISQGLFAFDDRAVSYLHEMGRRARERLLRYHYNLKKAYEYRLLRPYTTDLDLNAMFNRFKALAEAGKGARLDQADFQTLAVLYEDQLKQITSEVINWYNANVPERSASAFIRLTAEQLAQLNGTNSVLTLNFRDIGLFPPSEENHRIVNIEVREMRTSTNGNVGTGFLDLEIEHGGESVVTQGGRDYRFRHYNQDTQHPLVWGARYTPFANLLEPVVPSESAESLLRALLGPGASSDRILLWSRPGGQADFHMRRQVYVPPPANGDIRIEYLDLKITYDFYRRGSAVAVLEVVDESAISPLVELSRADQTGRQNGRGTFRRVFALGGSLALKFPIRQGNFKLAALRDTVGNNLQYVAGDNMAELGVTLAQNTKVRARYDLVPAGARFGSFTAPTPSDPTARFSIEGEYLAPYRVEYAPALPATNWIEVTNFTSFVSELLTVPAPLEGGFFRVIPNP